MRVLVTGATGFLARHLIAELEERDHSVVALALPTSDATWLEQGRATIRRGDVRDPAGIAEAMHDVEAVCHLAAAIGVRQPLTVYHAVNVAGTENVCRAALAAGVRRLVHVSTTSVYQQGLGRPVGEESPLAPLSDPYPVTKAEADALVQRMIARDGLPACIVRTSTFYGPHDRLNFGRIADRLRARRGIIIGTGRNAVPFTYVADVVQGVLLALEHPRAVGRVYNIADDTCPTQAELLRTIAEHVGAPPPRLHIPYSLLNAAAYGAEGVAAVTHSAHPLVTRFGVALYGANNRYSIDRARNELGYVPQCALRDGVGRAASWYRESRRDATDKHAAIGNAA